MIVEINDIKLWENQINDLKKMIDCSNNKMTNFELSSLPGSGKTFSVLFFIINKLKENSNYKFLIILPNTIINQWCNYCNQINLKYLNIKLIDINLFDDNYLIENNVFITSPFIINQFIKKIYKTLLSPFIFDYIIIDEYQSINYTSTFPIQFKGLILIDGSYNKVNKNNKINFLSHIIHFNRVIIKNDIIIDKPNIIEVKVRKKITYNILNDKNEIQITNEILSNLVVENYKNIYFSSFQDKIFYLYTRLSFKNIINIINKLNQAHKFFLIKKINVYNYFNLDENNINIKKYLCENITINDILNNDIVNLISKYINVEIENNYLYNSYTNINLLNNDIIILNESISNINNYFERINSLNTSACIICLENECDIFNTCCKNSLHLSCLNNWRKRNNTCPYCRNVNYKDINIVQNLDEKSIKSVYDTTYNLILKNYNKKIIIFSDLFTNEILYDKLINNLYPKNKLCLYENKTKNIQNKFKNDINILFLNKKYICEGMNFETANIIILTCKPDTPEQELQIIGRALRPGRTSQLIVYKFINI